MNQSSIAAAMLLSLFTACGQPSPPPTSQPLIVGGTKAPMRPFMAGLVRAGSRQAFCGGTFISHDVVMTAAHCVSSRTNGLRVAGGHRENHDLTSDRTRLVQSIKIHEDYETDTNTHDLALLFLKSDDRATINNVQPATISVNPSLPDNLGSATVAGWGATSFGGDEADELLEVEVPIISNTTCRSAGGPYADIIDSQICAGDFEKGGVDSCQGDSGGPLFTERNNRIQVIGVVSWGDGCATARKPGVYTRVASFKKWLRDSIDSEPLSFLE